MAWKAQLRLAGRFARLRARGVQINKICVAVARELAGFLLAMGPRNVIRTPDGRRILRYERGNVAGAWVEMEIVGKRAEIIDDALREKVVTTAFVHRRKRETVYARRSSAMFRRHCVGSPTHPVSPVVADFGLRDLRAKGATQMFRANQNGIRRIQLLLGHRSVRTREIYLKGLVPETVRPNEQPVIADMQ